MLDRLDEQVIEDADRCVKCALCLPHCPTYAMSGNESESPRGRIALMRALADESLGAEPGLIRHLDQCLVCRNCEPVCPAEVPYGRLIDHGRALLRSKTGSSRLQRFGLGLVQRPLLLRIMARLLRWAQIAGVARFIPAARRLSALQAPSRWPRCAQPLGANTAEVGLFLGCVARVLDETTLHDTIGMLNAVGYSVRIPSGQSCCGALHRHAGYARDADRLALKNRNAFSDAGIETVISTATGCGAELSEQSFPDGAHVDICAFLVRALHERDLAFKPLTARIVVYAPCTQRNVLHQGDCAQNLLRKIPGAEIVPIDARATCCGAAGSYVLEHSAIADELGAALAERIITAGADFVATANIGCRLHLSDHLRRLGAQIEVLHPVNLLARQLPPLTTRYNEAELPKD